MSFLSQNTQKSMLLRPRPHWGAYNAPRPLSWFQGDRFAAGGEYREGLGERGMGKGGERGKLGRGNSALVVGG